MGYLFDSQFSNRYILTLKEYTNRHLHFKEQFKNAGIESVKVIYGLKVLFKGCFKNTASRGITLTHLKVQKRALKELPAHVVIFEDDIEFVPNFKEKVEPILADLLKQDWDLFYFYKPQKGRYYDLDGDRGEVLESYPSGLLKITGTVHSHAYAINAKSLPKIVERYNIDYIKNLHLQIRVIDKSLPSLRLKTFAANEDLVYQSVKFESATKTVKPLAGFLENLKRYFKPVGNEIAKK
jgi:GR25 family glycosyltransferase involved in LPS biosynthesis